MIKIPFYISIRGLPFPHANYAVMHETGDTELKAVERSLARTSGGIIWGIHPKGYEIDSSHRVTAIIGNGTLTKRRKVAGAYPVLAEFTVKVRPVTFEATAEIKSRFPSLPRI